MTPFDAAVQAELRKLGNTLKSEFNDPTQRAAVASMTADLLMIPVRLARGEDVAPLLAALNAESKNRAVALRTRAETAAQEAWMAIGVRLLAGVLTVA